MADAKSTPATACKYSVVSKTNRSRASGASGENTDAAGGCKTTEK
jgi:hypothetical protein